MINIILSCVFGMSPSSTGEIRTSPVSVTQERYSMMKFEAGDEAKKALCTEIYGSAPDLAWIE